MTWLQWPAAVGVGLVESEDVAVAGWGRNTDRVRGGRWTFAVVNLNERGE